MKGFPFKGEETILSLERVKKSFGTTEVLKEINLTLKRGDFVAILGPSGSGKSTLLHIAGGLEIPSAGEVYLFGRRIDSLPEGERDKFRKGKVAYIFQFHYLLEDFTVYENLEVFGKLLKVKDLKRKIDEVLKLLRLEHRKDFKPPQLSGGERQRVAIGRALVSGAPLILADEPTGNLDPKQAEEIFTLFKELNKRGTTFLVVTHNLNLLRFFNRVYTLEGGVLRPFEG